MSRILPICIFSILFLWESIFASETNGTWEKPSGTKISAPTEFWSVGNSPTGSDIQNTNGFSSPSTTSSSKNNSTKNSTTTTVIVTEEIPGARCTCIDQSDTTCRTIETKKFECSVVKWLSGFQQIFASIIKYLIYIVMLTGVAALVGLGIAWSIYGSADEHGAKALKWYAINFIIGLTILFLFSYILKFLAPWVYN